MYSVGIPLPLHLIAQVPGQSALHLQDVFMYVQITAGRFCAHGVDPLSSRDSRGMLDLQDCGGRLSYTLPHSDPILILFFRFPIHQAPLATSSAILTFFQEIFVINVFINKYSHLSQFGNSLFALRLPAVHCR